MEKIKITFITGHLCKERHALLYELALDLGEYGAEVTVLTGFPSRRINNETRNYYLAHPIEQVSERVIVKRVGSRHGEGNGLFSRMIKYFFLSRKLYKEAKKTDTDVFYLYSTPFFLGYIGRKLRRIAPTLYNAQDLFPDTLIHTKKMSESNLLIKFFRNRERKVYQDNSYIVTISNEMKKNIERHGATKDKVGVIYNWADIENLHNVKKDKNSYFEEFGLDRNKFIVSYAGDLGLFQDWDEILIAAREIQQINNQICFVLIGSGTCKDKIVRTVNEWNLNNVFVFPLQPATRLSEVYSLGDIELLPIEKGITRMALPSKCGVIMATGNPILAIVDNGSDIDRTIKDNEIGVSVDPGSVHKLVDAILFCFNHRSSLEFWGKNAREFAEANYSRKFQTKKYFDCLCKIVKEKAK